MLPVGSLAVDREPGADETSVRLTRPGRTRMASAASRPRRIGEAVLTTVTDSRRIRQALVEVSRNGASQLDRRRWCRSALRRFSMPRGVDRRPCPTWASAKLTWAVRAVRLQSGL